MKLFIVIEEGHYHYEGTDTMVRGVFSTEKKALDRIRKDVPTAKRGADSWECSDTKGWDSRYMSLEKVKLDEEY